MVTIACYCVHRYSEADQYLCKRILASSGKNWSQEVAKAHKVIQYTAWQDVQTICSKLEVKNSKAELFAFLLAE
jgi:hypothetical protein